MPKYRKPTEAEFKQAAQLHIEQRFLRVPSTADPNAALDLLHARLAENGRLYRSFNLQDQRDAVGDSLLAVLEFLQSQGFQGKTIEPLSRPVSALVERENNSLDAMFTERTKGGRPRKSHTAHERTGILAALGEFWMVTYTAEPGPKRQKLAALARRLQGRWGGKVSGQQISKAREVISQESHDHPAALVAQNYYCKLLRTSEQVGPEAAIEVMIRFLNDVGDGIGFGKGGISKTPHVFGRDAD